MPKRLPGRKIIIPEEHRVSPLHLQWRLIWKMSVRDDRCALTEEVEFWPSRGWRFDFAHLESRVAVEIDGGVHSRGRHVRGEGFELDCEKFNAAAAGQWLVFRVTGRQISRHPKQSAELVWLTICHRMGWTYAGAEIHDAGKLAGGPAKGDRRK